jgi:hypothetical protein
MNETNGRNALVGIQCLQKMNEARPLAIYWGYIVERARHLCIVVDTPENLAIARLACLARATEQDQAMLAQAWYSMVPSDRDILTNHFLADGVNEMAFMFLYLPLYLERCKKNEVVGLTRSFLVLVDILCILKSDGCTQECSFRTMTVDLEDLAAFALKVKSSKTFLALSNHIKLAFAPALGIHAQRVLVSTTHWANVAKITYHDEAENETLGLVRRLERRIDGLTYVCEGLRGEAGRPSVSAAGMRSKAIRSVKEQQKIQAAQQVQRDLARGSPECSEAVWTPRGSVESIINGYCSTDLLRSAEDMKKVQFLAAPPDTGPPVMVGGGSEIDTSSFTPVGV